MAAGYYPTPYGLETCCVCDQPTTHVIPEDATGELLGYCEHDARALKAEFPEVRVWTYVRLEEPLALLTATERRYG